MQLCDHTAVLLGALQVEDAARFETERSEELRKLQVGAHMGCAAPCWRACPRFFGVAHPHACTPHDTE